MTKQKNGIYTIGHSTRTLADFIAILEALEITELVDIRTIAKSRHNPQFNDDHLRLMLHKHKIGYKHMAELGGLRHAHVDSPNMAWRNASFRGFADYMQTEDFEKGIEALCALAEKKRTVIMCAEAVPWRCHRSLIGDALLVRNFDVEDIFTAENVKPHKMTSFAHVHGKNITYPG